MNKKSEMIAAGIAIVVLWVGVVLIEIERRADWWYPRPPRPTRTMRPTRTLTQTLMPTLTWTPLPTWTNTATTLPTETATSTATETMIPTDTATWTPEPGSGFAGHIFIEVDPFLNQYSVLQGYEPFWVYAWLSDNVISRFDEKIGKLQQAMAKPGVKGWVVFTSYSTFESYAQRLPAGLYGVMYNSEPALSNDYNNIYLTTADNSAAKAAALAESNGWISGFAPLTIDIKVKISDAAWQVIFGAGMDVIGQQYQKLVDEYCVNRLLYETIILGTNQVESLEATAQRLRAMRPGLMLTVQVMPGYNGADGCWKGDQYAAASCGMVVEHEYQQCGDLARGLQVLGYDSVGIWALSATEQVEAVGLIQEMRR